MFGEDLSLGMLSEDDNIQDDFVLEDTSLSNDLDDDEIDDKAGDKPELSKDKDKDVSEDDSPESVADKDKDKTSGKANPSPGSDNKMSQIYSSLAAHFHETGVLPSLNLEETKIKSVEDIQEAIKNEIESAKSESQRQYEEAMKGGVSKDDYVAYANQKKQLDAITDESLASEESSKLRFNIIAQNFINKNFSQEDALKYAKRSQDLGEDVDDAKKALAEIKGFTDSNYQTKLEERKNKEKENVNKITDFVKNSKEFIKGIELTEGTKNNLIKQMTTSVGVDEKGNPITAYGKSLIDDPVKTKTVTEYLYLVTKGFTDFSKIDSLISSKATKNIDDVLRNNGGGFLDQGGKINFNNIDDDSTFSIDDEFKLDV